MSNPLLEPTELPAFSKITPELVQPAIEQILDESRLAIQQLTAQIDVDWDNLIKPLSLLDDRLSKVWSPISHLNSVKNSEALRDAYQKCLPLLSEYSTEVSQNRDLYRAYQQISESKVFNDFSKAKKKSIKDALLHFRLGGVDLEGDNKLRYQSLQKELSGLQSNFENNLLDSTQSWEYLTEDQNELAGLPEYALAMLKQMAEQKDKPGFRVTMDMPSYIAVITYADNRTLRKNIYKAFTTRASDRGYTDKKYDNAKNMREIVEKRQEKAKILGFSNYAEYSLQTKMASSVEQVESFLLDLAQRSKKAAIEEVKERQAFAESLGFDGKLEAWDFSYYSEKLKQHRYKISDQDLKPYFSEELVIAGLFEITKKLYAVEISRVEEDIDCWHESVGFYQIKNSEGQVIGQFYLDLYAREHKRGGAWMDECVNRYSFDGHTQIPVAYLTCNLTPPIGDKVALFTHDEVITLFHEFGHGLHHMLTRVDIPEVAGINGVEWDAVELPSQFMENFCWQKQALEIFAKHYQSKQQLPEELFEKMIAAKNFQSGLQMLRQLEFALFDIRVHSQANLKTAKQIQQILDEVRTQVSVVETSADNCFQNGFTHIFAGGYGAGYYSYKWAEVLSADVFSEFEEKGIFNPQTGKRFLQAILEQGGSRPALESFVSFLGREPDNTALLKHSGITT